MNQIRYQWQDFFMPLFVDFKKKFKDLSHVLHGLKKCASHQERVAYLRSLSEMRVAEKKVPELFKNAEQLCEVSQFLIFSVCAAGQWHVFDDFMIGEKFSELLENLSLIQEHYAPLGGIIGYQLSVYEIIGNLRPSIQIDPSPPPVTELPERSLGVESWIKAGLESFQRLACIFPVGGAGDRLSLIDKKNGEHLPAAFLMFMGKTLLEGLMEDLEAVEALYAKLTGKKIITPIVLMTSPEKQNHRRISQALEEKNWFGRGKENFKLIRQPLLPMVDQSGKWVLKAPIDPLLKPGGHGDLWKLMDEKEVFSWLKSKNRTHALVRQINNPLAGTDYALLAFLGLGFEKQKKFGFASCPRDPSKTEGVNVFMEKEGSYAISNLEYTFFDGSNEELYARCPANTNILFVHLDTIESVIAHSPFSGRLINMKKRDGVTCGRVESSMQNIADRLIGPKEAHPTYITVHTRQKMMGVTKHLGDGDETPVSAFAQVQCNFKTLLHQECAFDAVGECEVYISPRVGPLWSIIGQKIQKGTIKDGSYLKIDCAELSLKSLHLDGELVIEGGTCAIDHLNVTSKLSIRIDPTGEFYGKNLVINKEMVMTVPPFTRLIATMEGGEVHLNYFSLPFPTWFWEYSFSSKGEILLKKSAIV